MRVDDSHVGVLVASCSLQDCEGNLVQRKFNVCGVIEESIVLKCVIPNSYD